MLFGANDAGKTNILDAIQASQTGSTSRHQMPKIYADPFDDSEEADLSCVLEFELDVLGLVGHYDDLLFYDCSNGWLDWYEKEIIHRSVDDELDSLREQLAEKEITTLERAEAVNRFNRAFLDDLRGIYLELGESNSIDWPAIERDYGRVLDAHLASRRFRAGWSGGGYRYGGEASWLTPLPGAVSRSVQEASERLATASWESGGSSLGIFGEDPDVFLNFGSVEEADWLQDFTSAERVDIATGDYADLASAIEAYVRLDTKAR